MMISDFDDRCCSLENQKKGIVRLNGVITLTNI